MSLQMNCLQETYKAHLFLLKTSCFIAILFSFFAAQSHAQDQSSPTIIVVVRHAEKAATEGTDPSLSEAGVKRAQELVRVAEDAGVSAIYTTQYKRSKETSKPLADTLKIPVFSLEINKENSIAYPTTLAKEVLAKHAGRTVMVIGHSNTVPLIVEAFGGKRPSAIDDATEFDRMFIVIVSKNAEIKTIKARYGHANATHSPKP